MEARLKHVVVSGINIDSGGALSVLRDCLSATREFTATHRFTALVHDARVLEGLPTRIEHRAFPRSKRSWLLRLWYEYVAFRKLSRELEATLWLSLHDVTPTVSAEYRAVYCHNPAPFHRLRVSDLWLAPKLVAFRLLYPFVYAHDIQANDAVIVQQDWMRSEFVRRYGVRNVVVARPHVPNDPLPSTPTVAGEFIYPCFPRVFKNVETACRAFASLEDTGARLILTLSGKENAYARRLHRRFSRIRSIEFAGRKSREEVSELYGRACALVFPSTLETWGLPLSEFRRTGKPVFAADLPYAHESLAGYDQASFFDPTSHEALAHELRSFLETRDFTRRRTVVEPAEPFAADWGELWRYLPEGLPAERRETASGARPTVSAAGGGPR